MASPRFDVFLLETGGTALWLEAVATLDEAHSCLRKLGARPGYREYLILDQGTGRKHFVQVNQPLAPAIANALGPAEGAAQ